MDRPKVKLIFQTGALNEKDDPSYPFLLHGVLSAPEFMRVAFVMINRSGVEEVKIRAESLEDLGAIIADMIKHPRFLRYKVLNGTETVQIGGSHAGC